MGIKVAKFGGTSVADSAQIRKTAEIIQADPDRKYVVVSAPGKRFKEDSKITDLLYLVKTHLEQNAPYETVWQIVKERFLEIEQELGVDAGLSTALAEIESDLRKNPSADYIASRGEFLSAKVVAAFLGYDFVDTENLIIFGSKGRFDSEATSEVLGAELARHERAVLPGFYGTLPNGNIKTFSRGGSDITGAVVAQAVKADVYENWTDVSGFLMADPRVVKNAKAIGTISYKELRELSYMGASVLHENAIYPARQAGIPIHIRNTNKPEDPGTRILSDAPHTDGRIITGIAGSKDFIVIAIYKNMMSVEVGFIKQILAILEDHRVSIEHIPTGIDTVSLVMAADQVEGKLDDIVEEITRRTQADSVEVFEEMALIATVGSGMASKPGISARLFSALARACINIRMIDQGSSEMNIIIGVENKDFEEAIRAIYGEFVEG